MATESLTLVNILTFSDIRLEIFGDFAKHGELELLSFIWMGFLKKYGIGIGIGCVAIDCMGFVVRV